MAFVTNSLNFPNLTSKASPVGADLFMLADSAAGNALKQATLTSMLAAASSGGLTKIAAVNSTAAAVDFSNNLTSTYNNYLVVVEYAVPASNAVTWQMRVGTGAGPTIQTTNYVATGCIANTGSAGGQTSGTGALDLCTASRWSNTSTTGGGGQIIINNANSGTNNKTVTSMLTYKDSTGATEFGFFMPGQWQSSTVITTLRFLCSSGNITFTGTLFGFAV